MWAPPVISWFRFATVTIVISTINHSYWSYLHQLNYRTGPHIVWIACGLYLIYLIRTI